MAALSHPTASRIHAPHAAPSRNAVVIVGAAAIGLEIAHRFPTVRVQIFERDWRAVDCARRLADAAGLAERVTVHHQGAVALAREPTLSATAA